MKLSMPKILKLVLLATPSPASAVNSRTIYAHGKTSQAKLAFYSGIGPKTHMSMGLLSLSMVFVFR